MSRAEHQESRVGFLLRRLCDERLDHTEAAELAGLIGASKSAQRQYIEQVQLCTDLADWSKAAGAVSILLPASANGANGKSASQIGFKRAASKKAARGQVSQPRGGWRLLRRVDWFHPWLGWTVAAAMSLVLLLSSWSFFGNRGSTSSSSPPADPGPIASAAPAANTNHADKQKCSRPEKFVARIVEVTPDARWDANLHPSEFLMRLREGDKIHLLSGLAQLEFYSGARIILQGPSSFTPTGPAGGKLDSGRLTGKVEGGNFQLTTPTAKVVDLGTEFGVTVGPSSDTDVCVFLGEVEVQPGSGDRRKHQKLTEAYSLTQGMSVRVAATGKVSDGAYAGVDYDDYTRSFPLPKATNPDELDLVDIVCGGNGQGMRLAAAIDPLTGQWDRRPWVSAHSPGTRHGDGLFHSAASWHPFINGTFVPNKLGTPTQADTRGGTILLPKDRGDYTWGPIWARRAVNDGTRLDPSADSWGTKTYPVITERMTRCRLGGIGIHASVGITFDLKAIGKEHPGQINALRGVLANLENSKDNDPEWASKNPPPSADFRVFVDGKRRYEQLNFHRNVEGVPFDVQLSPNDRFLTFVTTDAGNTNRYDHIVIIDPVLGIQNSTQVHASNTRVPARVDRAN
jgi:hypothetical protein